MNNSKLKYLTSLISTALAIWLYFFLFESFASDGFWESWLLNIFYFLMIALFGNLFLAFHILAGTKWHNPLEPVLLFTGKTTVALVVMFIPLFWGMDELFGWINNYDTLHTQKWYLNLPFFVSRSVIALFCFIAPVFFINYYLKRKAETKAKITAGIITVVYIITFIIFTHDWLLCLQNEWHSTLFSWFVFSGLLLSGISFMALIYLFTEIPCTKTITDISKYLFSFSCTWMYLWYSQFMLIWYGNIQHETFYMEKIYFFYQPFFWANLIFNFGIPFSLLLSKIQKSNPILLAISSVSVLVGQWYNLYLIIYPANFEIHQYNFLPVAIFSVLFVLYIVPFIFRGTKKAAIFVAFSAFIPLISCHTDRNHPGYEYAPAMTYSQSFQPYTENLFFSDSSSMRNPVAGTVPRELIPFQYKKTADDRINAGLELKNPLDSTNQNIENGKFLFESFCLHCHGEKGDGMGKLFTSRFYTYKPGVLNGMKIQTAPEGEIFHAISEGYNLMGAHKTILRPIERWQIVLYIQSMELDTIGKQSNSSIQSFF